MCIISMGCISSKRDTCPTVFYVVNVDDYGNQLNSGQLEVTDLELIFYQRGKPPVRWPLKTLRRYGFDEKHFTFEFGRRSPTGPGIYAFLCRRAEQLVTLLEERLQVRAHNEGENEAYRRVSHRLSSISSGGPLSPLGGGTPLIENLPPAPLSRPASQKLYANEEVIANALNSSGLAPSDVQDETNNNKLSDTEPTYTNTLLGGADCEEPPSPGHLYMNIVPGTENTVAELKAQPQPVAFMPWEQEEPLHNYANLDVDAELDFCARPVVPTVPNPMPVLNYIVLDLEPGGSPPVPRSPTSPLPPDSPIHPPRGYTTIDFDKTTALSHSVDPSFDDSESSRKTRHNSHISQLPRHSSSVSD